MCKARDVPGFVVFLQHFPGGAAPAGLLAGGSACGIPGGAALGRATGWWCGLWDTRRRCARTGYSLVVRPVGWVARARAFMPTPGRFTVVRCEKARTFVRALISNMAVRGIDSLRSPLWGSPLTAFAVSSNWLRQLSNPVGGSHPPTENIKKKSPYFRTSSHLEYGGEGDSNPRYVAVYTLSVRAPSATRTPHHIVLLLTLGGQRGVTIGSCAKTVKHIFFLSLPFG